VAAAVVVVVVVRGGKLALDALEHTPSAPKGAFGGGTRVLGVSPKGSEGAECVCCTCLKMGGQCVCLIWVIWPFRIGRTDRQTDGQNGYRG